MPVPSAVTPCPEHLLPMSRFPSTCQWSPSRTGLAPRSGKPKASCLQHAHFSNSDFLPCISVLPFFLLYHFLFISENGFCAYQIFTRFCCIKFLCTHSVYHKTIHCSVFNWNLFQLSKIIRHYRGSRLLFWSSGYKMSKFIIDVFFSWILVFISLFVSGFRNGDSVKVWFRFCKH